jgi:diacylglycerol kinase family enzyme
VGRIALLANPESGSGRRTGSSACSATAALPCRVRCDGAEVFGGRAWQVTVACTGAFGGGAAVEADPRDGVLDVVVIEATSRARLAIHAYGVRAGRIERHAGVVTGAGRQVEVDTGRRTDFNVDGELVDADQVRCTVESQAFELVVRRSETIARVRATSAPLATERRLTCAQGK